MAKPLQISLAAARVNAHYTQESAAKELGVTRKSIMNWESGATVPSLLNLHKLSDLYDIPIDNISIPALSSLSEKGAT